MKNREELIKIYNQVILDIKNGYYENSLGEEIEFTGKSKIKKDSKMYESLPPCTDHPIFSSTKIYVENNDTYLKAIEMGPKAVVLNMASHRNPGGGVSKGSRAQEEELCRRSNLLYSLYSFIGKGRDLFGFGKDQSYPIPCYGGIYSPKISIYRRPGSYDTYDEPFFTNVISVAGILHPEIDFTTGMMLKKYVHIAKSKIRTILRIAIINKHSKLVLGALGCGAFGNPPKHIALLFKEVLGEDEFKNSFEEVCFAILDDGNTGKAHNPEGNYKPFVDVFGTI